jgi:hypothetical protein
MKISKFVQTIKSTGQCVVIHAPGEIYLSNRKAIYTAPEIPDITGTSPGSALKSGSRFLVCCLLGGFPGVCVQVVFPEYFHPFPGAVFPLKGPLGGLF